MEALVTEISLKITKYLHLPLWKVTIYQMKFKLTAQRKRRQYWKVLPLLGICAIALKPHYASLT
jgi:hypothetical protein